MSSGCHSCEALSLNSLTESNLDWNIVESKSVWNVEPNFDWKIEPKSEWSDEDDDVTICGEPLSLSDYSDLFYRSFR